MILPLLAAALLIGDTKRQALYQGLDPTSIPQHLAFYELYKDTPEGKLALEQAWKLISCGQIDAKQAQIPLSFPQNIEALLSLIQPTGTASGIDISHDALQSIERIAAHLPNRKLKGYKATTVEEIAQLEPEEIDLARGLLLSSGSEGPFVEAALDLMAFQVLARLPQEPSDEERVRAMNQLIFYEMGFRFPAHSAYSKEIDHFTFLPEVLESRRGVCLGVSTLYLCLAQRVGLPLEIITPPGHIYIRTKDEHNIETTLRGVHVHTEAYLGINNKSLAKRSIKEVIGMAHFNQASVWLSSGEWQKACACYEKALVFMPDDADLKTWYGSCLFLSGEEKKAKKFLSEALQTPSSTVISQDPLAQDILQGHVDKEALKAFFLYVDETQASIVKKRDALLDACKRCPRFRSGLFQLAISWLQLQRAKEAIDVLEQYHQIDPTDISVEFYLSQLYFSRYCAPKALEYVKRAEAITKKNAYMPDALLQLKSVLSKKCL